MGNDLDDRHAKDDEERLASSQMLFDQAEYLLNDEIKYAEGLRDSRKTVSTLLAVVFGIGAFRIGMFGSEKDQLLLVPKWVFIVAASLLTLAILVVFYGSWMLFTERALKFLKSDEPEGETHAMEDGKSSAALAVLDLDRQYQKILEAASPVLVVRAKTLVLKIAYRRLARANRRVRYRLEMGRKAIFVGLALTFASFLLYFWTMGIVAASKNVAPRREESHVEDASRFQNRDGERRDDRVGS